MSSKRTKVVAFPKSKASLAHSGASSIDVNASLPLRSSALEEDKLRAAVQRIVYYGEIKEAHHSAVERSARNISQDDIAAMLEGDWKLSGTPDWDEEHRAWEYKLTGHDIDGDVLVLKVAVNEELQRITVITKF